VSGASAAEQVGVSSQAIDEYEVDPRVASLSPRPNGLLRQYFPKGTHLDIRTAEQLDDVAAELNDRPRLCLADRTPTEAMQRWARQQRVAMIRNVH
jgi:hypothetical protein